MKIIFFGSDDLALANLEKLIDSSHEVAACVTQPDKPKGRHLQVRPPLIKECALRHRIPVLQPIILKEKSFSRQLKSFQSDLFVVMAYGRILPSEILSIPNIFCINVHASLLPKYRGAAPINWAIMNGDEKTGLTVMKVSDPLDAGDIIAQAEIKIDSSDTAVTLREKMKNLSPSFLVETLEAIAEGNYTLTKQNPKAVTYAPKLTKEMGRIDWQAPAKKIHNMVRGLLPWPTAYFIHNNKAVKVLVTGVEKDSIGEYTPGTVTWIRKEGIGVATGHGTITLKTVQPESRKAMDARSFVAGQHIKVGEEWID
jgi:methionyl-tRNA formyltransferase